VTLVPLARTQTHSKARTHGEKDDVLGIQIYTDQNNIKIELSKWERIIFEKPNMRALKAWIQFARFQLKIVFPWKGMDMFINALKVRNEFWRKKYSLNSIDMYLNIKPILIQLGSNFTC